MSIRQMAEVFYTPTLKPNQRLVALALADYADDHGRAWPSLANIGAKTGYSRRQTQRIVQELAETGYVEILIAANWNRTPLYQLHPEALEHPERHEDTPLPFPPDAQEALDPGDDKLTPPGDTGGTKEVTPATPGDDAGDTLNRHEPSPDPSPEPEGGPELATVSRETPEAERFRDTTYDTPRPRNPGWDALEEVFGYTPEKAEQSLWGAIAARANAEPDPRAAVVRRATAMVEQWGAKALTPASLRKWWDRFGTPLGQATDADLTRLRAEQERANRAAQAAALEGQAPTSDGDREAARAIVAEYDTYEEETA